MSYSDDRLCERDSRVGFAQLRPRGADIYKLLPIVFEVRGLHADYSTLSSRFPFNKSILYIGIMFRSMSLCGGIFGVLPIC